MRRLASLTSNSTTSALSLGDAHPRLNPPTQTGPSFLANSGGEQEPADPSGDTERRYDVHRLSSGSLALFRILDGDILERIPIIDGLFPNISKLRYEDLVQIAADIANTTTHAIGSGSTEEGLIQTAGEYSIDGRVDNDVDSEHSFRSALTTQISSTE
jgi:hypothetical protein